MSQPFLSRPSHPKISLSRRLARWNGRRFPSRACQPRACQPRQGQALILAVFIMLFAALLSSTFLILVASNTKTIGRSIDKTSARRYADEGARNARRLMALSTDADHWQPESEPSLMGDGQGALNADELPPGPGDSSYDEYWTPLDKAMGWALTRPYASNTVAGRLQELQNFKKSGGRVYAKVPDPRYSREATHYMLESRLLADKVDEVTDGGDKKFMLRVTSLGFSPDNPEVWARQILYKATNLNGSTFSYANFVSNYDFDKNNFATTRLSADVPAGSTTLGLTDLGSFSDFAPGQSLMLADGVGDPFTGLIQSVNRAGGTLTLKLGPPRAFAAASTTVSLAATLTSGLYALNDDGTRVALDPNDARQKVLAPLHNEVESAPGATTDFAPYGNGNFYNLGLKIGERAEFKARPPYARSWGTYQTYSGQNALTVTGPLDRSAGNLALYNATAPSAAPFAPPALEAAQNKYFRLSLTPQGAMQVDKYLPEVDPLVAPRPVQPANIDLDLYRNRAISDGVFVDNSSDFEKVGNVALDNSQLQRLWQRKSFAVGGGAGNIAYTGSSGALGAGTSALRLSWPRPGVDTYQYPRPDGSLEERGIRGWVSPWEFLPRGAALELRGDKILITADPLNDAGANDLAKALNRNAGTFSAEVAAPPNGILCAMGNLRVRGNWTGAPLTIVAGRNLYIEGAITAQPGQVALLAKGNVTLNPTQFMQRPAGIVDRHLASTPVAITGQNGNAITLQAGNIARFKIGDAVALSNNNRWALVSAISGDTLSLNGAIGTATSGIKLRQLTDPAVKMVDAENTQSWAYAIGQNSDNFYRNPANDGVPVNLGLRQGAQRVEVTIKAATSKPKYELHIKTDHDGSTFIEPNLPNRAPKLPEMWMWGAIDHKTASDSGYFLFNLHKLDSANEGDSKATLAGLQSALTQIKIKQKKGGKDDDNGNGTGNDEYIPAWELILPTSSLATNPYGAIPMRRLAAFDQFFEPEGAEFKVPLTTSVGLFWNDTNFQPRRVYGSFWGAVATEDKQNKPENLEQIKADYYGKAPQWQDLLALNNARFDATLSLQRDVAGDPDGLLPDHYLAGWHLESAVNADQTLNPVYSPSIQATIYAQTGSWFVIPLPAQTTTAGNEQAGRWRRSFYKVSVKGNIAQGFTPTTGEDYDNEPDPDGMAVGATTRWLDSLAMPSNLVNAQGAAGNWQTISYQARPLSIDNGLALPSTADVLYTYVE